MADGCDQRRMPSGQAAFADPNTPIGVDLAMLDDCVEWFKWLAKNRGVEQRVTDPTGVNIFGTNGLWTVEAHPDF